MRDAVGSTWIFGLVISFTLIFSAFLVLALTYAKAYKMKNEMTSIIEKYEGITTSDSLNGLGSLKIINQYLVNNNYTATGHCEDGEYGAEDLDYNSPSLKAVTDTERNQKFHYCIDVSTDKKNCTTIYRITVFYNFTLPVLGNIRQFSISGQTNEIKNSYFLNKEIEC